MLLLSGGHVVCPVSGTDERADVLVEDGRIARIGRGLGADGARVVDCTGAAIVPGLVDLCAELCDPGFTWREDLQSGSEAAAAGGFTTVLASPATDPVVDNPSVASDVLGRARAATGARVLQAGALTEGLAGQRPAEIGLMVEAGCTAVSDGARPVADALVLRRALEYARPFDLPVLLRPAEPTLESEGAMHEGAVSLRVGLRGVPAAAEELGVARAIALARLTGARIHLTHVTTARSVELIRRAREEGLALSASVPARHLLLTDAAIEGAAGLSPYDTRLRLLPPLRPEADRQALIAALREGVVDAVVSDHVPWTRVEKELEFEQAMPGAAGLETAFSAVLTAFAGDLAATVRVLSVGPGAVLGMVPRVVEGAPADLAIVDPEAEGPFVGPFRTRGVNDPLAGQCLRGRVRAALCAGRLVFGPVAPSGARMGADHPRAS